MSSRDESVAVALAGGEGPSHHEDHPPAKVGHFGPYIVHLHPKVLSFLPGRVTLSDEPLFAFDGFTALGHLQLLLSAQAEWAEELRCPWS
jgi:hypothetical protein